MGPEGSLIPLTIALRRAKKAALLGMEVASPVAFPQWSASTELLPSFCQIANQLHLSFAIRRSIRVKHFVEPHRRFVQNVRVSPRIPWVIGLRFAGDETPIDCRNLVLLCQRQDRIEGASSPPGHVLRAEKRSVVFLQEQNFLFEALRPSVIVKGDHIGVLELDLLHLRRGRTPYKIDIPDAAG